MPQLLYLMRNRAELPVCGLMFYILVKCCLTNFVLPGITAALPMLHLETETSRRVGLGLAIR